jgi:hypothetical protein
MRNTTHVMIDIGADFLRVVEAENRSVLAAFNSEVLLALGGTPSSYVMLIDGNDERGIDVGLSREGFPLGMIASKGPEGRVSARVAGHINDAECLELGRKRARTLAQSNASFARSMDQHGTSETGPGAVYPVVAKRPFSKAPQCQS